MIKMKRLHEKGEVATILAISAIVVIGISMISSAFFGGKKQSTSSKANETCSRAFRQSCPDGETLSEDANGTLVCCKQETQTIIPTDTSTGNGPIPDDKIPTSTLAPNQPTTPPKVSDSICSGNNQACSSNCGSGNDCVKYLESVTVPGLSDGSVINTDSFSCDIVTKNVAGVRTDTDNICGVKVNDQWPAWCPWDGVGQYMCGATITSRANCDLKSSHFNNTPVKAGDKLQVVAARKTGSCGNIPWNTAGSFITGPTFYYKQKGGGTNTTPQATIAPQKPRATTAPQQPQPTSTSKTPTAVPSGCITLESENGCDRYLANKGYKGSCQGTTWCPTEANPTKPTDVPNPTAATNSNAQTTTVPTSSPTSGVASPNDCTDPSVTNKIIRENDFYCSIPAGATFFPKTVSQCKQGKLKHIKTCPAECNSLGTDCENGSVSPTISLFQPTNTPPQGRGTLGVDTCYDGTGRVDCATVPLELHTKTTNCDWNGWKGTYAYATICQGVDKEYVCKYQCFKAAGWGDCSGSSLNLDSAFKYCDTSAGMNLQVNLTLAGLNNLSKYGHTINRIVIGLCRTIDDCIDQDVSIPQNPYTNSNITNSVTFLVKPANETYTWVRSYLLDNKNNSYPVSQRILLNGLVRFPGRYDQIITIKQ